MKMFVFGSKLCILLVFVLISSICFGYSGGDGSMASPWQISSVDDLLELSGDSANYNKHFTQTVDIDLGSIEGGARIFTGSLIAADTNETTYGFQGKGFSGVFDGQGHKISNLTIQANSNRMSYLGLFGCISGGVVKGINLENITVLGGNLSEFVGGVAGLCSGNISECTVSGAIYGNACVGGIAGCYENSDDGVMANCSSSGTIGGYVIIGGTVGFNDGGTINDCSSSCEITGDMNSQVIGGLVGRNDQGSICRSYATGAVTGIDNIGGLVGWNLEGKIVGCFAKGNVTGNDAIGGLVGLNCDIIRYCYAMGAVSGNRLVGGLVGSNIINSEISNCYSTGKITGEILLAGLVGQTSPKATVSNSLWDRESSGMFFGYLITYPTPESVVNVNSMTTKMLQNEYLMVSSGWRFNTLNKNGICWRMRSDVVDYPKLAWEFPDMDLNRDMVVDNLDVAAFATYWLMDENSIGYSALYDLDDTGTSKGRIDLADFSCLAKDYQK